MPCRFPGGEECNAEQMHPVELGSGAIRLIDIFNVIVWIWVCSHLLGQSPAERERAREL